MRQESSDEMQQAYFEIQSINMQLQQFHRQLQAIESQSSEIDMAIGTIQTLEKGADEKEILVPLTTGIFAKTSLKDSNEFIVNVGAGVAVKKTSLDTKKLLEEQASELQKLHTEIIENSQRLEKRAEELQKKLV